MTILAGRWDIDYVAKRVFRLVAVDAATTDTTLALYSALQDEFDEPAQMDDQVPMSAQTPTAFTMINEWFMDNLSTQFLTGGALTTNGWDTGVILSISYAATTPLVAADVGRTITGTVTGDTGVILSFDERFAVDTGVMYIRATLPLTDIFDNITEAFTIGGSSGAGSFTATYGDTPTQARTGENLWPNIFALGTLEPFTQLYVIQNELKIVDTEIDAVAAEWWPEGFFDILILTLEQDQEIDDGEVLVGARQVGALFDHFIIDLTAGGRQPIPLSTGADGNNPDGRFDQVFTDSGSEPFIVGALLTSAANGKRGILTAFTGTDPNVTIEYIEIGTAATREFEVGDGLVSGVGGGTGTAVASVAVQQNALGTPPTLVVANTDASLGAGEPLAPYSLQWDTNQNFFADLYGYWKNICHRGEGTGDVIDTDFAAQAGAETITGEQYVGSTLQAEWNTQTGTFVEGSTVHFYTSGDVLVARAVIVADHDDTGTGDMIVRNFRTLAAGTIAKVTDSAPPVVDTGNFATVASTRTIAPVKVSPFGTLAGGVIFGAPGVLLTDILTAENQNFQLIDDDGTVRTPPIIITVTVTGTENDDRVAVYVLDAPLTGGGVIVKTTFTLTAAAGTENGIADSNLEIDATIPNDQPAAGQVVVVDDSATDGREDNFQYDSFTGQIFTLTPLTMTGTEAASSQDLTGTLLIDADADFVVNGAKVGHIVRNTFGGANTFGVAVIVAAGQITMTALSGGDTWEIGDTYEINTIPVDYTTSDTAYVPLILDETGATSIVSANMTFLGNRDLMIRVRNGGSNSPITPFETGAQLGNSNLEIAAIRTPDAIAT